jgi:hypothetical protein
MIHADIVGLEIDRNKIDDQRSTLHAAAPGG